MALADLSLNFEDFYLERIPEPSSEDLIQTSNELILEDHLFSDYACLTGLVNKDQLRQARQLQYQLLQSSGSHFNLAEVLVIQGSTQREVIESLRAVHTLKRIEEFKN